MCDIAVQNMADRANGRESSPVFARAGFVAVVIQCPTSFIVSSAENKMSGFARLDVEDDGAKPHFHGFPIGFKREKVVEQYLSFVVLL